MHRPIIKVLAVCLIGILLALWLKGSYQPISGHLAGLHFDECQLPCWIGIEPGKTLASDALSKIQTHFPSSSVDTDLGMYTIRMTASQTDIEAIILSFNIKTQVVSDIELDFASTADTITIGEFYTLTGEPTQLMLPIALMDNVWVDYGLVFVKPNSTVYLFASPKRNRPDRTEPVHKLFLSQDSIPFEMSEHELVPWAGEKEFESYWCSSPPTGPFYDDFYSHLCLHK